MHRQIILIYYKLIKVFYAYNKKIEKYIINIITLIEKYKINFYSSCSLQSQGVHPLSFKISSLAPLFFNTSTIEKY